MFVHSKAPTLVFRRQCAHNIGERWPILWSQSIQYCGSMWAIPTVQPCHVHVLFYEKRPWIQVDVSKRMWEEAAASSRSQPIYCHTGWWFQRCWIFETTNQIQPVLYQWIPVAGFKTHHSKLVDQLLDISCFDWSQNWCVFLWDGSLGKVCPSLALGTPCELYYIRL